MLVLVTTPCPLPPVIHHQYKHGKMTPSCVLWALRRKVEQLRLWYVSVALSLLGNPIQ